MAHGRPLSQGIELLAQWYPGHRIGAKLTKVAQEVNRGAVWQDSLSQNGLIRRADAAVLKAAERVGNLQWALYELSDAAISRSVMRSNAIGRILTPLAVIVLAVPIVMFAVAFILPLAQLVESISI